MDFPFIRGEGLPDYDKNTTWNLLHAYIDTHGKILIEKYQGHGVQAVSIFQL